MMLSVMRKKVIWIVFLNNSKTENPIQSVSMKLLWLFLFLLFKKSAVSDFLWPRGLKHTRKLLLSFTKSYFSLSFIRRVFKKLSDAEIEGKYFFRGPSILFLVLKCLMLNYLNFNILRLIHHCQCSGVHLCLFNIYICNVKLLIFESFKTFRNNIWVI